MPELPEVETTRLGISPHILQQEIREITVVRSDLRQPISPDIDSISGQTITAISRRSKYLIIDLSGADSILIHLGMSGSLRIQSPTEEWRKHDHFAISLKSGKQLRYHDPRRFGIVLKTPSSALPSHPLLKNLGPEPLSDDFTASHLHCALRNKSIALKTAIMDAKIVVGVGNIYASESLFRARIHPSIPAYKLSKPRAARLVNAIKEVLAESIRQGGTTLRDFVNSDGQPGYFRQRLYVYSRTSEPCRVCATPVSQLIHGQRSTFYCKVCQKR